MARTFNGTSDQITFGSDAVADGLNPWTACALIRLTANVTDERQVLTKMRSDFLGKMYIALAGTNKVIVVVNRNGGNDVYSESAASVIALNTWTVVLTTWDGSTAAKIYTCALGGTLTETSYALQQAGSGTVHDDSSATLRLGARDPLDATFYAGGAADFGLWNRVLTDGERRAVGKGYSPLFFPAGLAASSRITGRRSPEYNYVGTNGTVSGTTYLDHPPVIYPVSTYQGFRTPTVASGGSFFRRGIGAGVSRSIGRFS